MAGKKRLKKNISAFLRNKAVEFSRVLRRHASGLTDRKDPERLHQVRVYSRRLRETLRILWRLHPGLRSELGPLRIAARRLTRRLGRVRELDVAIQTLGAGPGPIPLGIRALARRAIGSGLDRQLRRRRRGIGSCASLVDRIRLGVRRISGRRVRPEPRGGDSNFASEMIEDRLRRARAGFGAVRNDSDIRRLHLFRIAVKKLRYATEILQPFLSRARAARLAYYKELQSVLGRAHDDWATSRIFRAAARETGIMGKRAVEKARGSLQADQVRRLERLRRRMGHLI